MWKNEATTENCYKWRTILGENVICSNDFGLSLCGRAVRGSIDRSASPSEAEADSAWVTLSVTCAGTTTIAPST